MTKVLFVCYANVCRSQFAEAYYNKFTRTNNASSAGIIDCSQKYAELPDMMFDLMKEEGIDLSNHRSKPLTKKMVDISDIIFVLCKKEDCPDYLLNSGKVYFWDVPDPYGMSVDDTRKVRNLIKSKVQTIL